MKKTLKILFLFSLFLFLFLGFNNNINAESKACLIKSNGKLEWTNKSKLKYDGKSGYFGLSTITKKADCKGYVPLKCTYQKVDDNKVIWIYTQKSDGSKSLVSKNGTSAQSKIYLHSFECTTQIYYTSKCKQGGVTVKSAGWYFGNPPSQCKPSDYKIYTLKNEDSKVEESANNRPGYNPGFSHATDPSKDKEDSTIADITTCDDIPATMELIKKVYNFLKYLIPVMIIGLGILDFVKVVLSDDSKVFKDAWSRLLKRIIIGIVILILPAILTLIINMSGVIDNQGLNSNDIFCIFS